MNRRAETAGRRSGSSGPRAASRRRRGRRPGPPSRPSNRARCGSPPAVPCRHALDCRRPAPSVGVRVAAMERARPEADRPVEGLGRRRSTARRRPSRRAAPAARISAQPVAHDDLARDRVAGGPDGSRPARTRRPSRPGRPSTSRRRRTMPSGASTTRSSIEPVVVLARRGPRTSRPSAATGRRRPDGPRRGPRYPRVRGAIGAGSRQERAVGRCSTSSAWWYWVRITSRRSNRGR